MQAPLMIRDTDVKVTDVLRLIAKGFSYPQILQTLPDLVVADIQASAKLALTFLEQYVTAEGRISLDHVIQITASAGRIVNLSKVREQHPRAFMAWKTTEETRLIEEFRSGMPVEEIARHHQRKVTAIQKRLIKLGLIQASDREDPES